MLSVSLALICDYGVANSWLCGSLSYLKGLIIFNPLDAPQPDLPAGGQLMPTEPNRQSIIIAYKGAIYSAFIHAAKVKKTKVKSLQWGEKSKYGA